MACDPNSLINFYQRKPKKIRNIYSMSLILIFPKDSQVIHAGEIKVLCSVSDKEITDRNTKIIIRHYQMDKNKYCFCIKK